MDNVNWPVCVQRELDREKVLMGYQGGDNVKEDELLESSEELHLVDQAEGGQRRQIESQTEVNTDGRVSFTFKNPSLVRRIDTVNTAILDPSIL